jgi:hypothetical protein
MSIIAQDKRARTERYAGANHHSRIVALESHPGGNASLRVSYSEDHASITFDEFWQSACVAMTHDELVAVRDAINATLAEGWPVKAGVQAVRSLVEA